MYVLFFFLHNKSEQALDSEKLSDQMPIFIKTSDIVYHKLVEFFNKVSSEFVPIHPPALFLGLQHSNNQYSDMVESRR